MGKRYQLGKVALVEALAGTDVDIAHIGMGKRGIKDAEGIVSQSKGIPIKAVVPWVYWNTHEYCT